MYRTYRTEALVLTSRASGEANRFVYLFTRDLGLVGAMAQGVRGAHSKMRPHLGLFSHVRISLVRGKEMWRITNAIALRNIGGEAAAHPVALMSMVRLVGVVRRLVHGEEGDPRLYELLISGLVAIVAVANRDDTGRTDTHRVIEWVAVARILRQLGYLRGDALKWPFLEGDAFDEAVLSSVRIRARPLVEAINESLRASQL